MTDRELIQALTDELAPRIRELCADDKLGCDQLCAGNIFTAKCIVFQAADRLAALQAENAELRTQHRTEHCEAAGYDCAELARLRATLAQVEAEREAAVKFIKWIDSEFGNYMPVLYHHRFEEWRGAQGEG